MTARLGAVVFERGEDPDAPVADFVRALREGGATVAGLAQERGAARGVPREVFAVDVETGERIAVLQALGPGSAGCRVDPAAVSEGAQRLRAALARRPDLLVVSRFGRLESENGGMIAEIAAAVAAATPVLICVPRRYEHAWTAFAAGLDTRLPPRREAIEAWWN